MECIERASLATRSCQLSICQSGSWYLGSMKMKSAKKSFFVKDILGLRNEDDVSQLINERRKEEIDDAMEARKAEKKLHENNSYESKDPSKNKRSRNPSSKFRQCFTMQEVDQLERLFEETIGYPDTKTRRSLASEMKVSESKIQIWFQNRRAKFRRQKRQRARQQSGIKYDFDRSLPYNSLLPRLNTMSHLYLMNHLHLINLHGKRPLLQYEIFTSLRQNQMATSSNEERTERPHPEVIRS